MEERQSAWSAATEIDLETLRRIIQIVTEYQLQHGKALTATELRVLLRQGGGAS